MDIKKLQIHESTTNGWMGGEACGGAPSETGNETRQMGR